MDVSKMSMSELVRRLIATQLPGSNTLLWMELEARAKRYDDELARTDMQAGDVIPELRRLPGMPIEWWRHHLQACGTAFRGCAPTCPKHVFETTGVWAGPVLGDDS